MDLLLVACPINEPSQPALAIPTLAGHLKAAGFDVRAWDLNIECFHEFTSPRFLSEALERIGLRPVQGDDESLRRSRVAVAKARAIGPCIVEQIDGAKVTLRDPEGFYDLSRYEHALRVLAGAYTILGAAYFPATMSFCRYEMGRPLTAANIRAHLTDGERNIFCEEFRRRAIPRIAEMDPPLVGISLTYEAQLLPALTLCALLKQWRPGLPIILGGAYLTVISAQIAKMDLLWELADGIVMHEGESALAEICRRIRAGKDFARVPNLFREGDPMPHHGPPHEQPGPAPAPIHVEDFEHAPPPDFSDFPLRRYLIPEPVLPIQSCRGCYWGKCAFCAISVATRQSYRRRPVARVIQDMEAIHAATGATTFCLCDDATAVPVMKELAEQIRARKLPYTWMTEARLEAALDTDTCRRLAEGGCLHLTFGFESASDRVLGLMRKGTRGTTTLKVLAAVKEAGIGVNLQSFIGFPGETVAEAQQTAAFFRENKHLYTSISMTTFDAMLGSAIVRDPAKYGISIHPAPPDMLSSMCEITVHEGMSPEEVSEQHGKLLDGFYLNEVAINFLSGGMAHQFLYLRKFGRSRMDRIWRSHPSRPQDPHRSVVSVPADTQMERIEDEGYVVFNSRGSVRHVDGRIADAITLLRRHPQPLASIAHAVTGQPAPADDGGPDGSSHLTMVLLLLLEDGLLQCHHAAGTWRGAYG